jgi:hypothetical protein
VDISRYLAEIESAVHPIIGLVWAEHEKHDRLLAARATAQAQAKLGYGRADFLALNPDLDDEGLGTQAYWDTYFGPDRDQHNLGLEADRQLAAIDLLAFSRAALSGTVLQFAKQGLSLAHGQKASIPDGREIHGVALKEIVWEGRNHALHWEEQNPRPAIVNCLSQLAAHIPKLANFRQQNCSFEIVQALNWKDWAGFSGDIQSLA